MSAQPFELLEFELFAGGALAFIGAGGTGGLAFGEYEVRLG